MAKRQKELEEQSKVSLPNYVLNANVTFVFL